MKKIRLASGFLTANKALSIVGIVCCAICMVLIPWLLYAVVVLGDTVVGFNQEEFEILSIGYGILIFLVIFIFGIILAMCIVGLVLGCKAKRGIRNAKSRKEITKYGVMAIISGALAGVFGIPAGIVALTTKEEDFNEVVVDIKEVK